MEPIWVRPPLPKQGDRPGDDRANREHAKYIYSLVTCRSDHGHNQSRVQQPQEDLKAVQMLEGISPTEAPEGRRKEGFRLSPSDEK